MAPTPTTYPATRAEVDRLMDNLADLKRWLREQQHWQGADRLSAAALTLGLLDRYGPARVGELAERARVDVSVVSRQAAALEQAGLVSREVDPHDGRAHQLRLTDAGRERLQAARGAVGDALAQRLADWHAQELRSFNDAFARFVSDLMGTSSGRPPSLAG